MLARAQRGIVLTLRSVLYWHKITIKYNQQWQPINGNNVEKAA